MLGAKIDLDVASKEISVITGKEYANQSFAISVDIAGFSLGLDASRNQEFSTFVYGNDSVMSILSGKPFEFKPVFSTPWNVSSKEFWKLEFGASAVLGLEGTLDFE
ncbi:hypothetical protein ACJJIP_10175 [Microbulbifer sp. VTAC004]|uniref:hypothetical protein n=1 Tax=Microbulbifer sp. VTAC004 TaxID=3243386 RepID=UPI00403A2F60